MRSKTENEKAANSFRRSVLGRTQEGKLRVRSTRRRLIFLVLAMISLAALAPSPLRAQPARSLSQPPSITPVGTNDKECQKSIVELQRLIGEFAFVRGHRIYLVCDHAAWRSVMRHLTFAYGVIVNSRAAVSDIRLRETWFYAEALRKGADGHTGDYIYAHELGHFACSCIDEDAADRATNRLLDNARRTRFTPQPQSAP
jgi:hypothetical protein